MDAKLTNEDDKGRTPFTVASSKETRNEFRRFMASNPDRYDYTTAQIPSALTPEMENEKDKRNAERKKVQKKAQKQRIKRALAAEKRFAQQQAAKQAGITSW
ncbi:Ankyrin repeat and zinc finger domain-containing protein 1 [Desmophyllum pertusum]|uniref:Ankyrin repeat and zinc finger domain-containing protein 1 n=1 Tax=Desmophyllum pertusum TaxID=174260 RepID=A0A9W9ZE92_9CNID|nr:Ankyrin repeat and zinc finger domain-containing protein 1 [Desmophyllum pertusum]